MISNCLHSIRLYRQQSFHMPPDTKPNQSSFGKKRSCKTTMTSPLCLVWLAISIDSCALCCGFPHQINAHTQTHAHQPTLAVGKKWCAKNTSHTSLVYIVFYCQRHSIMECCRIGRDGNVCACHSTINIDVCAVCTMMADCCRATSNKWTWICCRRMESVSDRWNEQYSGIYE